MEPWSLSRGEINYALYRFPFARVLLSIDCELFRIEDSCKIRDVLRREERSIRMRVTLSIAGQVIIELIDVGHCILINVECAITWNYACICISRWFSICGIILD